MKGWLAISVLFSVTAPGIIGFLLFKKSRMKTMQALKKASFMSAYAFPIALFIVAVLSLMDLSYVLRSILVPVLVGLFFVWVVISAREPKTVAKNNRTIDSPPAETESSLTENGKTEKKGYQGAKEQKFIVLPRNQFLAMVVISLAIGYALHGGVIGKPPAAAFGGAVGQSIGVIAIACFASMIPAGIYWLFKRNRMPGLTPLIWVVWAIFSGFMAIRISGL